MKQARTVIGVQWGDEGKGKIIDLLASESDVVARFQGGGNAGHTVVHGKVKYALHNIPSGILNLRTINACASGMVLDLEGLTNEMSDLRSRGVSLDNLKISTRAKVILPYHTLGEKISATSKAIDTTGRGIGPAYTDNVARTGVRIYHLLQNPAHARKCIAQHCDAYNARVTTINEKNKIENKDAEKPVPEIALLDPEKIYQRALELLEGIRPHLADTRRLLYDALKDGKNVLLEGAQATSLDIDWGTYPYVTSSNTTIGGACTGTGLPPSAIGEVVGVSKAYCTRVGSGPFPTEEDNDIGAKIRADGKEFGTTTGRPRRCGWFDEVQARYAIEVNGITEIALMKLDVLDDLQKIKVCTRYKQGDKFIDSMPDELDGVEPAYEEFDGWMTPTRDCKTWEDLPENARKYVNALEKKLGVPITYISVGPDKEQTIRRRAA